MRNIVAIVFDGPFSGQDHTGEEIPCWTMTMIDKDENEDIIGRFLDYNRGLAYAKMQSAVYHCEFINDAMPD